MGKALKRCVARLNLHASHTTDRRRVSTEQLGNFVTKSEFKNISGWIANVIDSFQQGYVIRLIIVNRQYSKQKI